MGREAKELVVNHCFEANCVPAVAGVRWFACTSHVYRSRLCLRWMWPGLVCAFCGRFPVLSLALVVLAITLYPLLFTVGCGVFFSNVMSESGNPALL